MPLLRISIKSLEQNKVNSILIKSYWLIKKLFILCWVWTWKISIFEVLVLFLLIFSKKIYFVFKTTFTIFTKTQLYTSKITIAITTRGSLLELFLKVGDPQSRQNNWKMPVEEFFFQSSCSQKAGNFTKETPSKIFFKDSAKIINCIFL